MMTTKLNDCVHLAKLLTKRYAQNHVGRSALEKECIKKGYIIKRLGQVFPDCIESEKGKMALLALDFNSFHRKGGFVVVR